MIYVLSYLLLLLLFSYYVLGIQYFVLVLGGTIPIIINMIIVKFSEYTVPKNKYQKLTRFLDVKVQRDTYFVFTFFLVLIIIKSINNATTDTKVMMISLFSVLIYTLIQDSFDRISLRNYYYKKERKRHRYKIGKVIYLIDTTRNDKINKKVDLKIFVLICGTYILAVTVASLYTLYNIRAVKLIVLITLGIITQKRIKKELSHKEDDDNKEKLLEKYLPNITPMILVLVTMLIA